MKKGRIVTIINWLLLYSIPIFLLMVNVKEEKIDATKVAKKLSTSILIEFKEKQNQNQKDNQQVPTEEVQLEEKDIEKEKKEELQINKEETIKQEETKKIEPVVEEVKNDIITSYSGSLSFYHANCVGCSGITSTGVDVSDGKLYYDDHTYGKVRIIAAGPEIKKWSIVRIKNSSLGKDVLAIVLDRGGNIGCDRKFIIDVLTNSSESKGGIENNVTVDVIRQGK